MVQKSKLKTSQSQSRQSHDCLESQSQSLVKYLIKDIFARFFYFSKKEVQKVNNRIREICKAKKITISKVIEDTGFAKSYVHSVANGESIPTIKNARKISKVLGSTLEEVFPEENLN